MPTPARVVGIIPARLASTRLPGKVLLDRTGKPLIQHVYEAARRSPALSRLVIATDDQRVHDAVLRFGGESVLTRTDHPNGTSRLAEAASTLDLAPDHLIVNIQGDEPEIDPAIIDAAVAALAAAPASVPMATVGVPFTPADDPLNPAVVKLVRRLDGRALYFSRALIPHRRDPASPPPAILRHVGLYVYRRPFLDTYLALAPSPLEQTEMLEQLRVLEHGFDIAVAAFTPALRSSDPGFGTGIDTPEQYEAFVRRSRNPA